MVAQTILFSPECSQELCFVLSATFKTLLCSQHDVPVTLQIRHVLTIHHQLDCLLKTDVISDKRDISE
jgi:hypothetical protein